MCYSDLQIHGRDMDGHQMFVPMMCKPYMLVRGGNTVRHQEMDGGVRYARPEHPFPPSFNGACFISGRVYFNRSSLYQVNRIPVEIE